LTSASAFSADGRDACYRTRRRTKPAIAKGTMQMAPAMIGESG